MPSRADNLGAHGEFRALPLLLFFITCFGTALAGESLVRTNLDWLQSLRKPAAFPPHQVFRLAWTALFALMAFSGWRVWVSIPSRHRTSALSLFAVQLILNVLWMALFFELRLPLAAFIEILLLLLVVLSYILLAWPISPVAGAVFVPYALWLAFVAFLNGSLWWLNR